MNKFALLTLFLMLTYSVYAVDVVISKGQIQVGTLTLSNSEDTAVIEDGGAVLSFSDGISMENSSQQVTNNGSISTVGVGNQGIFANASADNSTITNNGSITTLGDDGEGISNAGSSVQINNTGLITSDGDGAEGILNSGASTTIINTGVVSTSGTSAAIANAAGGTSSRIENYGLLSTQGGSSDAMNNSADSSTLINQGTIRTLGSESEGIANSGNSVSILNSGTIFTQGTVAEGINNSGNSVTITNSGSIVTQNAASDGVFSSGNSTHLINSGTIHSVQADAIELTGLTPTLTLLRGSNIQGAVNSTNTLDTNVERGLNLFLTLSNAGFGTLNVDAPFIQVGNTLAVIDPTGLAMQSDIVADLADTFLGGIYRHRTAFPCSCTPCENPLWVELLGSYRTRDNRQLVDYAVKQGGMLIGIDCPYFFDNLSLFAGGSYLEAQINDDTQKARVQTYIAGASYEMLFCSNFFGATLIAGQTQLNNRRNVMNNLVSGGIEKARAFTRGLFLAPELTYAHQLSCFNCCPILSGTVRYAALFLGNYSEKGSSCDLTVKDRNIQLLTTRGEFSAPFAIKRGCFHPHLEPYIGVAGRFQLSGNRIEGELLAQTLNFDSPLSKNILEGLVGLRLTESMGSCDLFLNVEGTFDNADSRRVLGETGISFFF